MKLIFLIIGVCLFIYVRKQIVTDIPEDYRNDNEIRHRSSRRGRYYQEDYRSRNYGYPNQYPRQYQDQYPYQYQDQYPYPRQYQDPYQHRDQYLQQQEYMGEHRQEVARNRVNGF